MPTHDAAPEGATNDAVRLLCRGALTILSPGTARLGSHEIRCLTAALVLFDDLCLALDSQAPPNKGSLLVRGQEVAFRIVRLGLARADDPDAAFVASRRAIYLRLTNEV